MVRICLNMIVKNEAHVIEKTLNNILQYIPISYYVISDTGSTDNTQQIIKTFFDSRNIEGEIYDDQWKDFGTNRTFALNYAYNKSDFLFIFDADDSICGNLQLPDNLEFDKYFFKFGEKFTYKRALLINNRKKWRFVGVLHEYLENLDSINGEVYLNSDYYIDSGRTGDRSKDNKKYEKDALILENAFKEEMSKNNKSLAGRYAFYLAQSYKDCRNIDNSILWYEKVLQLDNWAQEKYYSCLKLGELYHQKDDFKKSIQFFLESVKYDNERIEGVVCATELFHKNNMHLMVNLLYERFKDYKLNAADKLFIDHTKYDTFLEYFNSISGYYTNNLDSAYESLKRIIMNRKLPIHLLDVSINNLFFMKNHLIKDNDNVELYFKNFNNILSELGKDKKINYNHFELWKILYDKVKPDLIKYNKKEIKDKDQNINIILTITTCKRFDLFEQTINSILNTWLDIDKIDYWYCIDDNSKKEDRDKMQSLYPWFDFYMKDSNEKGHLKSMNLIYSKLNELKPKYWIHLEDDFLFFDKMNYIEHAINGLNVMKYHNVKQVLFNRSYGEEIDGYNTVSYIKVNDNYSIHHFDPDKNANENNCYYWPHYSFRPSLVETDSILKLGNFDSKQTFFEMEYAKRWTESGYKSGFFNKLTNLHIGRLTKDRNNKDILNAYQMNNEEQFKNKNEDQVKNSNIDYKNNYKKIMKNNDNNKILFNTGVIKIFENNNFGYKINIMENALSHYKLWYELINDDKNNYYIVVEDNIHFSKYFDKKMDLLDNYFGDKDIVFLGYKGNNNEEREKYDINQNEININLLDRLNYLGTFFAYTINKNGAKKLIDYIEKNGIKDKIGILIKNVADLKICECNPPIVEDMKDQFIFISGCDQFDNDIYYNNQENKNIDFYKMLALNNDNCVAFNTLGFFKSKLDKLTISPYFKNSDGIYIKKEYYKKWKKYRIKMICNWCSSEKLCKDWSNMCKDGYTWNNIEITWENTDIDYYVIINKPSSEDEYYEPSKTIIFQMEPWVTDETKYWGVKNWGDFSQPDESKFLKVFGRKTNDYNNVFWQLELNYNQLVNLKYDVKVKKDVVASICSSKYFDEGHIARVDFLKFLESKNDVPLDIYNSDNNHNFINYRSPLTPYVDKSKGIVPYKYYFMVENNYEPNFITEKLWEPILCETLCFYYGCPNVTDYINKDAFVLLDMNDFEKSYHIMKEAIENDLWASRIDIIRKEKLKIINEMSFLPRIEKVIKKDIQTM